MFVGDVVWIREEMSIGSSSLYTRGGCIVTSRQGDARLAIHRLPRHTTELAMKHCHFKAVTDSFDHGGGANKAQSRERPVSFRTL